MTGDLAHPPLAVSGGVGDLAGGPAARQQSRDLVVAALDRIAGLAVGEEGKHPCVCPQVALLHSVLLKTDAPMGPPEAASGSLQPSELTSPAWRASADAFARNGRRTLLSRKLDRPNIVAEGTEAYLRPVALRPIRTKIASTGCRDRCRREGQAGTRRVSLL